VTLGRETSNFNWHSVGWWPRLLADSVEHHARSSVSERSKSTETHTYEEGDADATTYGLDHPSTKIILCRFAGLNLEDIGISPVARAIYCRNSISMYRLGSAS